MTAVFTSSAVSVTSVVAGLSGAIALDLGPPKLRLLLRCQLIEPSPTQRTVAWR
jgi:hypothetical protein